MLTNWRGDFSQVLNEMEEGIQVLTVKYMSRRVCDMAQVNLRRVMHPDLEKFAANKRFFVKHICVATA